MLVLLAFAFLAGIFTVLSPCVLPVLPALLASTIDGNRRRPLCVVGGLASSFAFFTLTLTWLVSQLGISADALRLGGAAVVGLFGLVLVVPAALGRFQALTGRVASVISPDRSSAGTWGGALVGASLGILWAPCAGPILAAVTALVATSRLSPQAVAVMLSYSLGVALPMIAIAYGGRAAFSRGRTLGRHADSLQRAFGVVMIAFALTFVAGVDRTVELVLASVVPPEWANAVAAAEDSPQVRDGLASLRGSGPGSAQAEAARPPTTGTQSALPKLGMAPELSGVVGWVNGGPVTLSSLRGKVVLVDFWTYSCINCLNTIPHLTEWDRKYRDAGLVVIGVHTPEFEFEKSRANVEQAVAQYGIRYLVAQDNDYSTWDAYDNHYWPAEYLVDASGQIRYEHFGEGAYDESEAAIRELLAETGMVSSSGGITLTSTSGSAASRSPLAELITPETYLGAVLQRQQLVSPERGLLGRPQRFSLPAEIPRNTYALEGVWTIGAEEISASPGARLDLTFYADRVFVVLTPGVRDPRVEVSLDGARLADARAGRDVRGGVLIVGEPRLYSLLDLQDTPGVHTLSLRFVDGGASVYSFTFG